MVIILNNGTDGSRSAVLHQSTDVELAGNVVLYGMLYLHCKCEIPVLCAMLVQVIMVTILEE